MKNILLLFTITLFLGCGPSKAELDKAVADAVANKISDSSNVVVVSTDKSQIQVERISQVMKPDGKGGGSIRFLTIDGHEYIQWYTCSDGSSDIGVAMCHDENCDNEIHPKPNL